MKRADPQRLEEFFKALSAIFGDKPRLNEPLSNHTTSRLGGPADIWLPVGHLAELVKAVNLARQYRLPTFLLGSGANLLIRDTGIRGLVIGNKTRQVRFNAGANGGDSKNLGVESGVILPSLARRCAGWGLSGFEWAVGVPGTIGGAVANNAGAYGSDMASTLVRAELLSPAGERVWQEVNWFEYGYRSSRLKRQQPTQVEVGTEWVVLQAELQLVPAAADEIWARMNSFNERRKNSQPPGATIGSMFKNPAGDYAGRLIEVAGLKGYRIGQAEISAVHANFFQNLGGATAAEMLALIETVQEAVETKFGIKLELEIEIIGEFSEEVE
jgi:UDP-N-acetylmuramate dehydrogenase